jgi:hypothetical protein
MEHGVKATPNMFSRHIFGDIGRVAALDRLVTCDCLHLSLLWAEHREDYHKTKMNFKFLPIVFMIKK